MKFVTFSCVTLLVPLCADNHIRKLRDGVAAPQVTKAGLGPLLMAAAFWSLEVGHQYQANAGLFHHLTQLGAGHVDRPSFVKIRESRDDDGEVVKDDDVHVLSICEIPDLADEMVGIHRSEVVIQKATASPKDAVKALSDFNFICSVGVKVDGFVELDADYALHRALGALLEGDVPDTEPSPKEVVRPLPANAGLAHARAGAQGHHLTAAEAPGHGVQLWPGVRAGRIGAGLDELRPQVVGIDDAVRPGGCGLPEQVPQGIPLAGQQHLVGVLSGQATHGHLAQWQHSEAVVSRLDAGFIRVEAEHDPGELPEPFGVGSQVLLGGLGPVGEGDHRVLVPLHLGHRHGVDLALGDGDKQARATTVALSPEVLSP